MHLHWSALVLLIVSAVSELVRLQSNGDDSFVVDSVTGERLGGRRKKRSLASQMDALLLHEQQIKSNANQQFLESKDKAFNTLHKVKHGKKEEIAPIRFVEEEVEEAAEEMSIGSTADEVEVREAQEEIHIHTETFFRIEGEDEAPIEAFRIESES